MTEELKKGDKVVLIPSMFAISNSVLTVKSNEDGNVSILEEDWHIQEDGLRLATEKEIKQGYRDE